MIKTSTRFLVVADSSERFDPEVVGMSLALETSNDAHVLARRNAISEPGRRFFIVEVVGYHEARVLPPTFTSARQPELLRLTAGGYDVTEDLVS